MSGEITGQTSSRPVINLREIARLLTDGEPLPKPLAEWLGVSLQSFLERQHESLEDVLGLRWGRGGVPWWMDEAIRVRDDALRQLATHIAPIGSLSERARLVRERSLRYATTAWLRDRYQHALPENYAGTEKEWLWRAFKSQAAMPLGERRLRQILSE